MEFEGRNAGAGVGEGAVPIGGLVSSVPAAHQGWQRCADVNATNTRPQARSNGPLTVATASGMCWLHVHPAAPFHVPTRGPVVAALWCACACACAGRYYPLNALTAVSAPIISFLSYTADVLRPELRTPGFGLVTASFSIS